MLSSHVQRLLNLSRRIPFVPDPRTLRESFKQIVSAYGGPKPSLAKVQTVSLSLNDEQIPVRFYYPSTEQALPVMVYCHGGGHMVGSVELFDSQTRFLAQYTGCTVVSVDYRLAPENPFPCGLNDCLAVTQHLIQHYEDYHLTSKVWIAGDSGGGNLAANVALRLADQLAGQLLIYPSTDFSMTHPSIEKFGEGYLLDKIKMQYYFDAYLPPSIDRQSPMFSPLYANHQGLPPTFIALADHDPLFDEGREYAEKLKLAGVTVRCEAYPDTLHAFATLYQLFPEQCEAMYRDIAEFIHEHVGCHPA